VAAVARLHGLGLVIEDANPGCRIELRYQGESHGILPAQGKALVDQLRAQPDGSV
jgi:hypothetical protein